MTIFFGLVGTLIFGGITFGLLVELWSKPEDERGLGTFFGFWIVAGLSGYFAITGWQSLLSS